MLRTEVGKWKDRAEARDLDLPRIHWGKEKSTERLMRRLDKQMKDEARHQQWILRNSDLDDPNLENERRYQRHHLNELLEDLSRSINAANGSDTDSCFHEIFRLCEDLGIRVDEETVADIEEQLEILELTATTRILLPKAPEIVIPELILPSQALLMKKIADNPASIFAISPREFEEIIAEIFHQKGFHVELTKQTADGGRDIIAIHNKLNIHSKYIIECKRYAPERKVSVELVRSLLGVKTSENANKAVLATTSSFTSPAKEFAHHNLWHLDLKAYNDVMGWITDYVRESGVS
jgi:restriction system protein